MDPISCLSRPWARMRAEWLLVFFVVLFQFIFTVLPDLYEQVLDDESL